MIEKGLSSKDRQKGIYFADTLKQLQLNIMSMMTFSSIIFSRIMIY